MKIQPGQLSKLGAIGDLMDLDTYRAWYQKRFGKPSRLLGPLYGTSLTAGGGLPGYTAPTPRSGPVIFGEPPPAAGPNPQIYMSSGGVVSPAGTAATGGRRSAAGFAASPPRPDPGNLEGIKDVGAWIARHARKAPLPALGAAALGGSILIPPLARGLSNLFYGPPAPAYPYPYPYGRPY